MREIDSFLYSCHCVVTHGEFDFPFLFYLGLVTCYTLQLSSDDCGGHTEYIEFFSALRRVFRVLEQRRELEHEIEDILKLVQNDYIEGLLERTENELTKKTQERRLGIFSFFFFTFICF